MRVGKTSENFVKSKPLRGRCEVMGGVEGRDGEAGGGNLIGGEVAEALWAQGVKTPIVLAKKIVENLTKKIKWECNWRQKVSSEKPMTDFL